MMIFWFLVNNFYEGSELSLLTVSDKKRDEIVKISGRIHENDVVETSFSKKLFCNYAVSYII